MIRTIKTKNGDVVEITTGDAYAGPGDCFSKLHVNTTATWIRTPTTAVWFRSTERSEHRTRLAIAACESAKDVVRTLAQN